MGASKHRRLDPTHDWQLLLPLFGWSEQERYEEIRPLMLFDVSVAERAQEVGTSTSTLYRRLGRFAQDGMESLFEAPRARRRRLPPAVRRLIVDLKAEYPAFNLNEIANVVRAAFGRKPDVRSVGRVLSEEPIPLKIVRNYPPYHESEDPREGRAAIVALRLDGWSVKTIAGYLKVHHSTVYRALERWKDGGFEGLADGSPGPSVICSSAPRLSLAALPTRTGGLGRRSVPTLFPCVTLQRSVCVKDSKRGRVAHPSNERFLLHTTVTVSYKWRARCMVGSFTQPRTREVLRRRGSSEAMLGE